MSAAQNGHSNVVETLLQHGAIVDQQKDVSTGNISSHWLHIKLFTSCTMLCHVANTLSEACKCILS